MTLIYKIIKNDVQYKIKKISLTTFELILIQKTHTKVFKYMFEIIW